ncbi:MAG: GYD domain-containing protein [Planctomycetota bacterium]
MATFISTIRFTDQGAKAVGETTRRAKEVSDSAGSMGIKVHNIYWTLGEADGLLVFEAPDEEAAAALMLKVAAAGNVLTQTKRAFTADEMDQLLAKS